MFWRSKQFDLASLMHCDWSNLNKIRDPREISTPTNFNAGRRALRGTTTLGRSGGRSTSAWRDAGSVARARDHRPPKRPQLDRSVVGLLREAAACGLDPMDALRMGVTTLGLADPGLNRGELQNQTAAVGQRPRLCHPRR